MQVRFNCMGSVYGSAIEDFPECMSHAMDAILETKKVQSIVFAREREYEYDYDQVKLLIEIAHIIEFVMRERLISNAQMMFARCKKCYPEWHGALNHIVFDLLRKDPIGGYVQIVRELRNVSSRLAKERDRKCQACLSRYARDILGVIKGKLEETQMIRAVRPHIMGYHIGDRTLYRQILMPSTRPNFMFTRYMVTPPEGGRSVDRYMVGDVQIEIYKLPNEAHYFYHVLPPEFKLSEEKYAVLDAARSYMATHRPTTAEFMKSERIRDIFFNIGRDTIRDTADSMKVRLAAKEVDQLANILTRYTAGFGVLEILLADEKLQDIYLNSPIETQPILIFHGDWGECKTNLIPTREDAEAWATRLRIQSGRPLDEANPVLDVDIAVPGGKARFAVVTNTLSPEGLGFAIRRHRYRPWTLPLFIQNNYLSPLSAGLLSFLVEGNAAMLVAGGRSSGKTSLLTAMMLEVLPKVRIVTIEDTLELPVEQMRNLKYNIESLKSRSVITRVETEMPADEALRTSLRLGDSAMIVGEIRSVEAKALWEAMRIGALSNVVAGTIHGESPYGVYDRVVNDLGVPPTSFKATDIIIICKMLRSADGLKRFRRVTDMTEVRKKWEHDPVHEGGFVDLMQYSGKEDKLKGTDTLTNGESEVLNRIASYVKEWSGNWEAVWGNIQLRAKIKETMARLSTELNRPDIVEAEWVVKSNNIFHLLAERIREETGYSDPRRVYDEWLKWFKSDVKKVA